MKKAANILFLVGFILSIVMGVGMLIASVVCIVLGAVPAFKDALVEFAQRYAPEQAAADIDLAIQIAQATLIACGVVYLIVAAFAVPSALFAFKARNSDNRTYFILNIVFGVLACVEVNVVGAIFALIKGDTIENKPQDNVVEVESTPAE